MTKLHISESTEAKAVATILNMGVESLDPENYENLEKALAQLCETRSIFNHYIRVEHIALSGSKEHRHDCNISDSPPAPCNCNQL
jgi:hypothetical protein